jgi:hypothetical protein
LVQPLWKSIWKFIAILKIDKHITLLYLSWAYIWRCVSQHTWDTCTCLFIVELFTTPKLWNQSRCPNNWWMEYQKFCKCHNVPPPSTTEIPKKWRKKSENVICRKIDETGDHHVEWDKLKTNPKSPNRQALNCVYVMK